jgi:hypothetical protein
VSLLTRLDAKLDRSGGPDACWPFRGAHSRGSRREVHYGVIREGRKGSPLWRVNRLVLLLEEIPLEDCPTEADLLDWLHLANRQHADDEAAHTCDRSTCHNPAHLEWAIHPKNIRDAWDRRNRQAQEARI